MPRWRRSRAPGLPARCVLFRGIPAAEIRRAQESHGRAAFAAIPSTLVFYEAPQRVAAMLADLETGALAQRAGPPPPRANSQSCSEETRGGTLGELAAHYAANEARGEFVILVAPPNKKQPVAETSSLDEKLRQNLHIHSLRDAVAPRKRRNGRQEGRSLCARFVAQGQRAANEKNQSPRHGLAAEALCRVALRLKGYGIIASRYRSPLGEIDIVASRGRCVALIEVKARASRAAAAEALGPRQRERLQRAAGDFLARHPHL